MTDGQLRTRALRLSYFTVAYNLVEGLVSVVAGALAGSVALVGFGLDSFVESLSGGVMIWRFGGAQGEAASCDAEKREERALKLVGYTFWILGAYVLYESVEKLLGGERPEPTGLGIAIVVVSLVVMPALYLAKRRTAERMGSRSLAADSKQTLACMGMSAAVLLGLILNQTLGLWQADPVIGILIAALLFREGRETITEGKLCSC
ncbi:MAG TPA: cation transporter [Longimicrobiaceae bacterium]|nr:cation transporter [Longimicrobiaceae bacterium]